MDLNTVLHGDCLELLKSMEDDSVDSIVTDPPYGLSFMGKKWDYDVPSEEIWGECLRVLKPGGYLLAFAGTRTQHRMAVRIEDAGFEIRDMIAWVYGSGFPKSLDVSKAIDKAFGVDGNFIPVGNVVKRMIPGSDQVNSGSWIKDNGREYQPRINIPSTEDAKQWEGWGTALKPALEPITVARKPLSEKTVASNVLKYGTGSLNIDGCRVESNGDNLGGGMVSKGRPKASDGWDRPWMHDEEKTNLKKVESAEKVKLAERLGRWPANFIHDGSEEVVELFPVTHGAGNKKESKCRAKETQKCYSGEWGELNHNQNYHGNNRGSASRFFYCPKASKKDRGEGNNHPTVKPINLMKYLCRLVTPPNGIVLDPFCGSGSTGVAAISEGFNFIGIEREKEYADIAIKRIEEISSIEHDILKEFFE